ncbi:UvrD-helicase domain-containing protein [Marinomonas sp. TI.3.20]|uniref:UvrD-helicase domain-containing protein n=1 Tax=Marinomonas sp. TI.3.20 TaxID=3121296 RepID=UPI0031204197
MTLHYTQASAGSGKTYSIEHDVADKLERGDLLPSEIIAVTFTKDAAEELKGRISQALIGRNKLELATGVMSARIGTVHSVFGQLLSDFAFELGLSPEQRVIDDQDKQLVLAEALDSSLSLAEIKSLNQLSLRLSVEDWRADVLKIIELMRTNAMLASDANMFAQTSIAALQRHLPTTSPGVTEAAFIQALEDAVQKARQVVKPTKGLLGAVDACQRILRQQSLTWQNWVKVSKLKPTKMGEPIFAQAMFMGLEVLKCQAFQQELTEFIALVFQAAQKAMDTFADIKKSRGLIDFVDQENLALIAIDHPVVQQRLKEEVRYLIIDEFQDTSPLQLALFSKVSELVDDVLMVGDAKQAIYGFRGSDPKLTLDVLDYVQQGGGQTNTLSNSYRSRSGLVELTNELFTASFSHLLKPDQVQLTPNSSYSLASAELGWWTLAYEGPKSNERTLSALAEGIRAHIEAGVEVWDKKLKRPRQAMWRDLAVLCRGNAEAAELAGYCARIGIPVSLERAGLVETPEISLALACLRRLIDPSDSLASAEILTLNTGDGPEQWLQDRLAAVSAEESWKWNNTAHPVLERLARARENVGLFSIKEALDTALLAGGVANTVCQWNEGAKLTEHRLANLAQLSNLVSDYESHCSAQFLAATPTGFILWLKNQEQRFDDKQASNPGDAITIATYHKSKGLEWPIVICHSLDSPLKVSLFGPRITSQALPFDWQQPLQGRSLCYWPNPFPGQRGNDVLTTQLNQSPEWKDAEQQALNEAIQLLYVGITRARDQLILTTIGKEDAVEGWLQLLNNSALPPAQGLLKLSSGATLNVDKQTWIKSDVASASTNTRSRHWLAPKLQLTEVTAVDYFQPASKIPPHTQSACSVLHDFGNRIPINGKPNMDQLGSVLHHCLALVLAKPDLDVEILNELVKAELPGVVQGDHIFKQGLALFDWVKTRYPDAVLHTEMPIMLMLSDGGLRQGAIDLVVEADEGWIVIDHKSNPQPKDKWLDIAQEHSGQLKAYRDALEVLSGKPVISTLVHFSVSGGLVEVTA